MTTPSKPTLPALPGSPTERMQPLPPLPLTILCVDDEPMLLRGMERLLRVMGNRVLTAPGGAEGLAVLAREQVDLLIADVDMPDMSGIELVEKARREFPDVVRVLLTARSDFKIAQAAIHRGEVLRYLVKPCEEAELAETLREAAQRVRELRTQAAQRQADSEHTQRLAALEAAFPGIGAGISSPHVIDAEAAIAGLESDPDQTLRTLLG